MSRYLSIIGGVLLLFSFGCNGIVFESVDDDGTLVNLQAEDLTYFISTNPQDPHHIKIAAINQKGTMCLDGEIRPSCDVDVIDYTYAGMNEDTAARYEPSFLAGKGVIRGWMQLGYSSPRGELVTKLYTAEGWLDPTPNHLETTVYEVDPMELWCIRAPCPEYQASVLDSDDSTLLHEVDLFASQADEEAVEQGYSQLAHDHILVSGVIDEYTVDDGQDMMAEPLPGTRTLVSDTFYLRVVDK